MCAETQKQAKAAAAKVKVDLEELPAYMSAPEAMAEDAIEIHPGTPNVYFETHVEKGEPIGPIFEKADVTIEGDYYVGRQPHMPIEPDVAWGFLDEEENLVIYCKSIALYIHGMMIAPGLGVPTEKLFLVQAPTGGTFGYKFSPTMEALVGAAVLATGRPAYLGYDWYQQQTYTGKRSPFFMNVKFAADKEGKLLAMESDWTVDHGPYSEFGDLLTLRGAQFIGAGYDIPNIFGNGRTVCTNHAWGSAFRGYGAPQSEFASETLIDELAEKLGMDPFELRYKNLYREGATTPTGQTPEILSLPEIFDKGRPVYESAKKRTKAESTDKGQNAVSASPSVSTVAALTAPTPPLRLSNMNPDGTVTIFTTWEDHGQGADMGALGTLHETPAPPGPGPHGHQAGAQRPESLPRLRSRRRQPLPGHGR